jgi:hypothetical protein
LWIHVDDGLLVASLEELMGTLKVALFGLVTVKWDKQLASLVGIKIRETQGGYQLQQPALIEKLLAMESSNILLAVPLANTLLDSNPLWEPDNLYLLYIGVLLYLAQGTRPDILFVTHYLAQFSLNPDESQWAAVCRLVAYVRATAHFQLSVEPVNQDQPLWVYVDASWMGEGARSHHGYMATLLLVHIAWAARRQTVVARLTCHAEFIALLAASVEGVWLICLGNS